MNLAIRGIFAEVRWNSEGTLLKDAFPDERFDYTHDTELTKILVA